MSDEYDMPIERPDQGPKKNERPDRRLTGEEKRARMKEQFKKELRQRKEFLDATKRLRQSKRLNDAVQGVSRTTTRSPTVTSTSRESSTSKRPCAPHWRRETVALPGGAENHSLMPETNRRVTSAPPLSICTHVLAPIEST